MEAGGAYNMGCEMAVRRPVWNTGLKLLHTQVDARACV